MTEKNKSTGIRLQVIAETEVPPQERYIHEAMAFFEFLLPPILELEESRFILRRARHQSYQLECIYKATEKDEVFGEKTATTEMETGTPNLKVLVDAIVEWGKTQKYPPGTPLSLRFEVAEELKQYSYIFLQILHHGIDVFAETESLAEELRRLFDTIIETEVTYLYEQGKEKKCRILDKDLLKKLKKEILMYKEGQEIQAVIKSPLEFVKWPKSLIDSKLVTKEQIERQLPLFEKQEGVRVAIQGGVEGIDLTVYEERAFNAVLVKSDQFDYQDYSVNITKSELFDLAGVEKRMSPRGKLEYDGHEKKKIEDALIKGLNDTRYPIILSQYSHYNREKKRKEYEVARTYQSLISVVWFYRGVGEDELVKYEKEQTFDKTGRKLSPYFSHWQIGLNPLAKRNIDKFRLLPINVYTLIKEYKKSKAGKEVRVRVGQDEMLYIQFLHRHRTGKRVVRINYVKLARQLKLTNLIEKREWGLLRKKINGLHELGIGMGFLTSYEIVPKVHGKDQTVDVLCLNPDGFYNPEKSTLKKAKSTLKKAKSTLKKANP